ncbi:MAG TPA: hypothetical protein DCQ06_02685 [Myxococcales bacterium]|nr:hypothetical protein [Myxococcales bacterium]HAN30481.1 hypothetical protein [Myxococcales bacterium]
MNALRSFVFDNFSLKLLSLLLAVLIHVVVRGDAVRELSINVAIEVSQLPEGRVFVGVLPQELELQVRGRWGGIRKLLNERHPRVSIDLSEYRDGERFSFDMSNLQNQLRNKEIEILGARPSGIDVRLEPVARRQVPVQVSTTGTPAPGFSVGPNSVQVSPRRVEITGPANSIRRIRQVRVAPIDLTGADRDLRVRARLLGVGGPNVQMKVDEVDVQVRLEEQELRRSVAKVPIEVSGCPAGLKCLVTPATASVTLRGPARLLLATIASPSRAWIRADVGPAISRKQRRVRLKTVAIKGLQISVSPAVAKFTLLGEIPAK